MTRNKLWLTVAYREILYRNEKGISLRFAMYLILLSPQLKNWGGRNRNRIADGMKCMTVSLRQITERLLRQQNKF